MSEQDVTVEVQDVEVETDNQQIEETQREETQVEVEKTIEEKLAEAESIAAGRQKKIDRQTAAYNAAQKNIAELQRQIQEMEARLPSQKEEAPQPPDPSNYNDYEKLEKDQQKYIEDRAKFLARQEIQSEREKLTQAEMQRKQQEIVQQRQSLQAKQEQEFLAVNPLYESSKGEVLNYIQMAQNNVPLETQQAVLDVVYDGNIPQLINYFGENNGANLGELERIFSLSPTKAAVEIYKIQQTLGTPEKKEVKPIPKPVTSNSKPNSSKPLAKKSAKEVLDWVNS